MEEYRLPTSTCTETAHWLPCNAVGELRKVFPAKTGNFFHPKPIDEQTSITSFRGRELRGLKLKFPGFIGRLGGATSFDSLTLWGHDDLPLRSDSVPQGFALLRVQHELGQSNFSEIEMQAEMEKIESFLLNKGA